MLDTYNSSSIRQKYLSIEILGMVVHYIASLNQGYLGQFLDKAALLQFPGTLGHFSCNLCLG